MLVDFCHPHPHPRAFLLLFTRSHVHYLLWYWVVECLVFCVFVVLGLWQLVDTFGTQMLFVNIRYFLRIRKGVRVWLRVRVLLIFGVVVHINFVALLTGRASHTIHTSYSGFFAFQYLGFLGFSESKDRTFGIQNLGFFARQGRRWRAGVSDVDFVLFPAAVSPDIAHSRQRS